MRHNRSVLAARAAVSGNTISRATRSTRPGTNLLQRNQTVATTVGYVKRTRCAPMTGAQKNSIGRTSEWAASPYTTDPVMIDSKWSATMSEV